MMIKTDHSFQSSKQNKRPHRSLVLIIVLGFLTFLFALGSSYTQAQTDGSDAGFSITPTELNVNLRQQSDVELLIEAENSGANELNFDVTLEPSFREALKENDVALILGEEAFDLESEAQNPLPISVGAFSTNELQLIISPQATKDYSISGQIIFQQQEDDEFKLQQQTYEINVLIDSNLQTLSERQDLEIFISAGMIVLALILLAGLAASIFLERRKTKS